MTRDQAVETVMKHYNFGDDPDMLIDIGKALREAYNYGYSFGREKGEAYAVAEKTS